MVDAPQQPVGGPGVPVGARPTNPNKALSDNVQGDILFGGMPKFNETLFFFKIVDAAGLCGALGKFTTDHIDTASDTFIKRDLLDQQKHLPDPKPLIEMVGANIAFSMRGLRKLGEASKLLSNSENLEMEPEGSHGPFASGMLKDASALGDPDLTKTPGAKPEEMAWNKAMLDPESLHGVILVAGSAEWKVRDKLGEIQTALHGLISEVASVKGKVRPGELKGHEHFGFEDGISQPALEGLDCPVGPNAETIPQGVFLCRRNGDNTDKLRDGTPVKRPAWMADGSFLVFRKLEQDVAKFNQFLTLNCAAIGLKDRPDKLGARLIGRWKSGCPIDVAPDRDNPLIGAAAQQNNNFEFGTTVDFKTFPHACHIRKTYPRDDLKDFEDGPLAVDRGRILRRGIPYGLEVDADPDGTRGLLFACYQSSITQGFKRIQETWVNNPSFISPLVDTTSPMSGLDPIIGQKPVSPGNVSMTGINPANETEQLDGTIGGVNQFVTHKGGEYFFSPSITALTLLLPPL